MEDLGALLELTLELGSRAGALLVEGMAETGSTRVSQVSTKTSRTDLVTEMDRASENLIVKGIRDARPNDAILAEEGSSVDGTSGVRWIIDPLDGTTNYTYGYPAFAVSLGIEVDGVGAVGVVVDPARGETFSAIRGGPACLNGRPVQPSGHGELATALVATGFGYVAEQRARQAAVLTAVLPAVRDIRRAGSAALDLCWVACGRVDGYYEFGIQPWDMAAGSVIASAAGARVCGVDGGPPSSESVVAGSPMLIEALVALLRQEPAAAEPS